MPTFGSINPTAPVDGVLYSASVPVTTTEADLNGGAGADTARDPIPTEFGAAIVATIVLTANGFVTANNTYVVMQQDMGDGVWVDLNWCFWSGTQGSATFVFSNGVAGANTFQQSRQANSAPQPQSNGSNQLCLGGRIRFVGKSLMAGGSSIAPGAAAIITATIRYKLLGLR